MVCSGTTAKPLYLEDGVTTVPGLLIKSGNFIQTWMIIMYSLMGCCCCLAVVGAFCSKR